MAGSTIGVAVIGAGMAGRAHVAGYRAATTVYNAGLPPVELVAVADVNAELAATTAHRYGYARAETSWQAVAAAPDVHAVSVVVANHLHREVVEGLLSAGKHVLCEKPFAPTVEDAAAMVRAAAAAPGLQAGVGFTFRRSPAVAAVAEQVRQGAIGSPLHFSGHYWCDYAVDPDAPMSWRYRGGPGSGALADIGSHLVDLAEVVCGPVRAVRGGHLRTVVPDRALPIGTVVGHGTGQLSDVREEVGNEDLVTFSVEFDSGAAGTLTASRVAYGLPNSLGFEVFGQRGAASFDLARAGEFRFVDGTPGRATNGYRQVLVGTEHPGVAGGLAMDYDSVGYGQNDLFVWQARAFLGQVAGLDDLPAVPSFEHGLHNLAVLRAVVASAQAAGAAVTVPTPSLERTAP